ncbi:acetylxylan esterase [Paraoerskovia sediminicola]|uniref:Acetylxylan esterase n=1 Tax=Paraoerskovia sediminicola TaxID=1138587 RepID=A0ABM8G154_9CELL|nr:acetylxylan esterase [Paraoerskovia sediminicola]BDZ41858.1 acetylxylan esterase [Paraoerskovia sediminicola]
MPQFDLSVPELEAYEPPVEEPADFDEFWAATLAESRALGAAPTVERVDAGLTVVSVDDVTFPGFAGDPVRAWLTRPADAPDPLPAVVEFVGYGGGRGLPQERLAWAAAGYAHLLVDTRGQGSGWGSGGDTPDPHGSGPASPGFVTRGIDDPADHYYRRVFTDGVRAVDAVRGIDGVDPDRVSVAGISQGGGIALAVAGLADGLRAALVDVPFLCAFRRAVTITGADPYGEITRYLSVHRGAEERVFRTLSYLDGANHAARATAPAVFSVALMDEICPPSTVYSAFHRYGGAGTVVKDIDVHPFNGHEGGQAFRFARHVAWLAEHAA